MSTKILPSISRGGGPCAEWWRGASAATLIRDEDADKQQEIGRARQATSP